MNHIDITTAIVPVTVADIKSGKHDGSSHIIFDQPISHVCLCGRITRESDEMDQPVYTLDDATGMIKVVYIATRTQVDPCGAARIIGHVRPDANGDHFVQAISINAVTSFHFQ